MNNAKLDSWISEEEATALVGEEAIEEVLALNCDFTGRIIDDVFGVEEMSASIGIETIEYNNAECDTLTVYYLVDKKEIDESEGDLSNCDYSNYYFYLS